MKKFNTILALIEGLIVWGAVVLILAIAFLSGGCSTSRPAAKDYSEVQYFKAVGYKEAPLFKNYQKK